MDLINAAPDVPHRPQSKRVLDKIGGTLIAAAVMMGISCLIGAPCSSFTTTSIVANTIMALLILVFND